MKHLLKTATAAALLTGASASAAPVFYPVNGHWYDAIPVSGGITWDDAKVAAEALGGHLATINTIDENAFITASLPAANADYFGYWLGGFQPGDTTVPDVDPAAGWEWVTGETFDASFWSVFGGPYGEPNDCDCRGYKEDALHFWATAGAWNDLPREDGIGTPDLVNGFVVEYTSAPPTVPDSPLGWAPVIAFAAMLVCASRSRLAV